MSEELVIDENNFHQYFKDCRRNKPNKGDIMAKFTAMADFIDGQMKKDVIDLLLNKEGKTQAAIQLLRKVACATEKDSIRVCKEICQDLANGINPDEVERKPYKYTMESFYYTKKEYVPVDDPHWSIISLVNLEEFLDKEGNKLRMESKFSIDSKKEQNEEGIQ
jgi:hypothetical protein